LDPNSPKSLESTATKFGVGDNVGDSYPVQNFREGSSRDLFLEFWDPFHISGTVQAKNFKFGMNIDH